MAPTLIQALQGKRQLPPPIWLMRQAGRYLPEYQAERQKLPDFMEFCFTPEAVIKVTLKPIQRFDFDAAIIFSDILTIPHLLGQTVSFQAGHGPQLISVEWDAFLDKGEKINLKDQYFPLFQSIQTVRRELKSDKALIGFAGSPWTIATYMIRGGKSRDFNFVLSFEKENPDHFQRILNLLALQVAQLLKGQIKAGCDVVQIFDSWASIVPQEKRDQWLWQPLKAITHSIQQEYPTVPIIYYGKGVAEDYPHLIKKIPCLVFGLDHSVDCQWARDFIQPFAAVQGNLDPEKLVIGNFQDDVKDILQNLSSGPFVFNLGHGILPQTPMEHVYQLVHYIKSQK